MSMTVWTVGVVLVLAGAGVPTLGAAQVLVVPDPLPPVVQQIELVYVGDQPVPSISLSGTARVPLSSSYRPNSPRLDLLAVMDQGEGFGPCRSQSDRSPSPRGRTVTWGQGGGEVCGRRWAFQPGGVWDLLSYSHIRLRGRAEGLLTLAVEDDAARQREDHVALGTVSGRFDVQISLQEIGRRIDLRRLTAFIVTTRDTSAHVELEIVEAVQEDAAVRAAPRVGFWAWRTKDLLADPEAVFALCRRARCTRLLIQMPGESDADEVWAGYASLFAQAQAVGIEALALDGYPEAILDPYRLAEKIRRVMRMIEPPALGGIQLDLEPYLMPGFFDRDEGPLRYLQAIELLHEVVGGRVPLSIVVPFWLADKTVAGRPLAFSVMDRVEDVAVMSYRTNVDEVANIADDILRYGVLAGRPVWLAVETTPLPVERHVVFNRAAASDEADAVLDYTARRLELTPVEPERADGHRRERFRFTEQYRVSPEGLTFAGRSRPTVAATVQAVIRRVPGSSLRGVLIHDVDGWRALPD